MVHGGAPGLSAIVRILPQRPVGCDRDLAEIQQTGWGLAAAAGLESVAIGSADVIIFGDNVAIWARSTCLDISAQHAQQDDCPDAKRDHTCSQNLSILRVDSQKLIAGINPID